MKRFQKIMAVLCMLALLLGSLPVATSAEEKTPATPTDLEPVITDHQEGGEEGQTGEAEESNPEETADEEHSAEEGTNDSLEIIIVKSLQPGQIWNGTVKRKTPSIIKIDFDYAQTVHILIEGHDVLAAVQKADRYNDHPEEKQTDPETDRLVIEMPAEAGSYLLSLRAGENSLLAKVNVTVMTQATYDARLEENQASETEELREETETEMKDEEESDEQADTEIPDGAEKENPEEQTKVTENNEPDDEKEETALPEGDNLPDYPEDRELPENRSVKILMSCDEEHPRFGSVIHFTAVLNGYEELNYTVQWITSKDNESWIDVENADSETMDVIVTKENYKNYWRLKIMIEGFRDETDL